MTQGWKRVELTEHEEYVHRNYAGFRLSIRHIHGAYHWQAQRGNRVWHWGQSSTLELAKKAAEQSALRTGDEEAILSGKGTS